MSGTEVSLQQAKQALPSEKRRSSVIGFGSLPFQYVYVRMLSTISRKFAYADDLTSLHCYGNWKDLEGTFSLSINTLSTYSQTMKPSHTKMVTAAFHLNNLEAKRELKVLKSNRLLPFCPALTYLGAKLRDRSRSVTIKWHCTKINLTRGM